jgi:hypothetical protein
MTDEELAAIKARIPNDSQAHRLDEVLFGHLQFPMDDPLAQHAIHATADLRALVAEVERLHGVQAHLEDPWTRLRVAEAKAVRNRAIADTLAKELRNLQAGLTRAEAEAERYRAALEKISKTSICVDPEEECPPCIADKAVSG